MLQQQMVQQQWQQQQQQQVKTQQLQQYQQPSLNPQHLQHQLQPMQQRQQQKWQAVVKNTFIHIPDESECCPMRPRSGSVPPSMKLFSSLAAPASNSCTPCSDTAAERSLCSIPSVATTYAPTDIDEPEGAELRSWPDPTSSVDTQETPPPPTQVPSFDSQMQKLVTVARSLLSSWPVAGTEATESKTGWSIVLYVNKQHERHINQVIANAKQAMLHAAKGTTNVYLLGYGKDVMLKFPGGVAAVFVGVDTQKSSTCWKFIEHGKCKPTCTNDHPKYRKNLIMRTQLVD